MAKPLAKLVSLLTPKWRWAQFSLGTLFVIVTVLCVGFTLVIAPAERQRRAVAAIEAFGGRVAYAQPDQDQEASEAFPKPFLRRWLPRGYFDEVRGVDLNYSKVTDAGLVHLHGLTRLEWLDLRGTPATDAGMTHLQGLVRLELLLLDATQVTDAGLLHLQELTGLKWLWLNGNQVTDAGLAQLRQALPNCRISGP